MGAVVRQGRYFAVAFVIMLLGAQISLQRYTRWAPWLYLIGVATLVAVMFFGVGAKGAQRWLDLGFVRFQPSEMMKLAVPMMVAWYLSDKRLPPSYPRLLIAGALLVLFVIWASNTGEGFNLGDDEFNAGGVEPISAEIDERGPIGEQERRECAEGGQRPPRQGARFVRARKNKTDCRFEKEAG